MLKHFRFEYEDNGRLIFGRFALWLEDGGWVAYRTAEATEAAA
jgi:hypothetical protein